MRPFHAALTKKGTMRPFDAAREIVGVTVFHCVVVQVSRLLGRPGRQDHKIPTSY
jgi:hypothetical protein